MAGLGRAPGAARHYESYADSYPDDPWTPDVLMEDAELSYKERDFKRAQSVLERIGEKYPRWRRVAEAIVLSGKCQEELGDYEGALKTCRDFLAQYPAADQAPWAREHIEFLLNHKIKNREAGIDELARLMGELLTDKSPAALAMKLGRIYFRDLKDYESAEKQFSTAVANGVAGTERAEALYSIARSRDLIADLDSGRAGAAITSYGEFLKEFPSSDWSEEASYRLYRLSRLNGKNGPRTAPFFEAPGPGPLRSRARSARGGRHGRGGEFVPFAPLRFSGIGVRRGRPHRARQDVRTHPSRFGSRGLG
jgi:outer membrane protein assembly factor BamD (BamD/ComL family)